MKPPTKRALLAELARLHTIARGTRAWVPIGEYQIKSEKRLRDRGWVAATSRKGPSGDRVRMIRLTDAGLALVRGVLHHVEAHVVADHGEHGLVVVPTKKRAACCAARDDGTAGCRPELEARAELRRGA